MAVLEHVHHETVNHQEECYEKRYDLANAASASELAASAEAAMRRATKNEKIAALVERAAPTTIVLRLPLTMEKKQIALLQARMESHIKKSPLA